MAESIRSTAPINCRLAWLKRSQFRRSPTAARGVIGSPLISWRQRISPCAHPILIVLLAAFVLSACAGAPRRNAPGVDGAQVVVPGLPADIRWFGESRHDFRARSTLLLGDAKAAAKGGPVNVLVLSGGGAGGAFGAGALVGWSRLGTRPEFHIVTGVSAGALIAPFAFLGSEWNAELSAAFSPTKVPHLMQRTLLRLLFGTSLYRGTPLYRLVDGYVTNGLLSAIAKEARKGRLLVVATTDLDSEQPVFWNLGRIAQQGGERARQLFRDVLVASASIPGVFPPMLIPVEQAGERFDEMHVDGSVMTSLFFIPDLAAILPDSLDDVRGGHIYILVNGTVGTTEIATRSQALSILKRSVASTLEGNLRAAIGTAYTFSERQHMTIDVTEVPNAYPLAGPLDFDATRMASLFNFGLRCAISSQLWSDPITVLEEPPTRTAATPESAVCPGATRPGYPGQELAILPAQ
jgi:hypothetical protein